MSRRRSAGLLAAVLAGALALAGCGPSSPGPAAGAAVGSQTTTAATSAAADQPARSITVAPHSETGQPTAAAAPTPDPTTSSASTSSRSSASSTTATAAKPEPKPATVSATPAFGSSTLNPGVASAVKVAGGQITKLAVYAEDGSTITGKMSADKTSWTSTQRLRYGGRYHAVGQASGQPGSVPTTIDGTWTTFSANTQATKISPGNGAAVGVAVPIIIRFGACVADHAAVQKHVTITSTPKVAVSGTWVQHDGDNCRSLDIRPKGFWPAGTKVHVAVDLLGVQVSDGLYGARDIATSDFTIGRNLVTYADAKTHTITVKKNGVTVATYPTSMGRGDDVGDPRMTTRSGIHIVLEKDATKKMSNPKFGYKDLPEPWSVRISNNGEFIHQNMGTIDQQGHSNQSHGCLNLSDVNAKAYFAMVRYGDPVVVTGTSVELSATDGDIHDWTIPWDQWTPLSA